MELKNYQEEIVQAVLPLVLEDHPDVDADEAFLHDVAAYVLNRLPPRYIMSERGLTRIAAEHWLLEPGDRPRRAADGEDPALLGMVQLLILINKAIQVVFSRRRGVQVRKKPVESAPGTLGLDGGYWHNFPQIIGRVVDGRTKTPLASVGVTLTAGRLGQLASERGWSNPAQTSEGAKGCFSFWPRAIRDEASARALTLRFTFEHPGYRAATHEVRYRSRGEIIAGAQLRLDRVINLGTQALVARPAGGNGRRA